MGGRATLQRFPCAQLLRDAGGAAFVTAMQCEWASASVLRAVLPPAASAAVRANPTTASRVAFTVERAAANPGGICPAASCSDRATLCVDAAVPMPLIAVPLNIEAPPVVELSAPPFTGVCDDVPLTAMLSSTPRHIEWRVTTNTHAANVTRLAAALATLSVPSRLPTISPTLNSALFDEVEAVYTFRAVATDYRNVSASSPPLVVRRSSLPKPTVQLLLPSLIRGSSEMRFTALVAPVCGADEARTLTYEWSLTVGDGRPATIGRLATLVMPSNTLPPGMPATLFLDVYASTPASAVPRATTLTADLIAPLEPIVASIAGGTETAVGIGDALHLDSSSSFDPSFPATQLMYSWRCLATTSLVAIDVSDGCTRLVEQLTASAMQAPVLSLPPFSFPHGDAVYTFELQATSSAAASTTSTASTASAASTLRSSSAHVNVTVSMGSPPLVSVELRPVRGTTIPSTNDPIRVSGRAAAATATTAAAAPASWLFLWSLTREVDDVAVQLPTNVATARDLVLPATGEYAVGNVRSVGVPPGVYRARLQVFDAMACADANNAVCVINGRQTLARARRLQAPLPTVIGFASVRVEVNAPPRGGTVQANPPSGVSGRTRFELSTTGFADADAPLTYVFWSEPIEPTANGAATPRTYLASATEYPTLRGVILPQGRLRIGCTATDSYGASADAAFSATVDISPPTQSVTELLGNASRAADGEGSASQTAQITSAAIDAFGSSATAMSAFEQQEQAAAIVRSLSNTVRLAANSSAMLATVAGLASTLSTNLGAGTASLSLLSLVEELLDPAVLGSLPPAVKNGTLGSLGNTLSNVLGAANVPPPPGPPHPPPSPVPASLPLPPLPPPTPALPGLIERRRLQAVDEAYQEQVAASVTSCVDRMAVGALAGTLSGEGYALNSSNIVLLAARRTPATLANSSLSSSDASAGFTLPAAAVATATAAAGAGVDVLDVQLVTYPAIDPYAFHPSAERTAGVASGLTLRHGSATLELSALSVPIRITIPLRADLNLSMEDGNPAFGARCGDGSRGACVEELRTLNDTLNAQVGECAQLERSGQIIFSEHLLTNCTRIAERTRTRVHVKQTECDRLSAPPCSGRGTCAPDNTCVCEPLYFGATCGNMLSCAFWNASASLVDAELPGRGAPPEAATVVERAAANNVTAVGSFDGRGCTTVGVAHGQLICDCSHLTLFEVLWETEWWSQETYATIAFPTVNMPFSRWSSLWTDLGALGWQGYTLTGSVLVIFTLLLLWANYRDRHHEYQAYMVRAAQ